MKSKEYSKQFLNNIPFISDSDNIKRMTSKLIDDFFIEFQSIMIARNIKPNSNNKSFINLVIEFNEKWQKTISTINTETQKKFGVSVLKYGEFLNHLKTIYNESNELIKYY